MGVHCKKGLGLRKKLQDFRPSTPLLFPWPCLCSCLQEQDPERRAAMHAIKDTRVDVCLYFVPPHRLRKVRATGYGAGAVAKAYASSSQLSSPVACRPHAASIRKNSSFPDRQIDLQFMSELAELVPVVPVLAKADTMTAEELKARRPLLLQLGQASWGDPAAGASLRRHPHSSHTKVPAFHAAAQRSQAPTCLPACPPPS